MSKFVILHKETTDFAQNSSCHRTTIAHFLNSGKWDDTLLESTLKSSVVEILNIFCKHFQKHLNLTDTIVFFNNPISINAQSSKNRTGYGNNYFYNTLIYEGTKYGATSQFPIVGYKISKIWNIQGNSMYCKTPDETIYGRSLPGWLVLILNQEKKVNI